MKINLLFFISFILFNTSTPCQAQLIPDSTFGQNGYFITNYVGLATFAHRIHELSNGDILAIGTHEGEIRIWKYNSVGQLITSFGTNGIASNPALDAETGNMHTLFDFEVYDNNKIMVLSKLSLINQANYDSSRYSIALSSFNADGSINTNFNGTGYLIDNPDSMYEFNPYTLLIDKNENNDIYVGGEAYEKGHSTCPAGYGKWFISKYRSNGTPVTSFNNIGYLLESTQLLSLGTPVLYPQGRLRDLAFMANGSIRAVGAFHNFDRAFFDFAIKSDGTFDTSFGVSGVTKYDVNYDVLFIQTGTWSKILNDGSVLFYTTSYSAPNSNIKFIKHKLNGSIDSSYGINGLFTFTIPTLANYSLIYKSDNSILLSYYQIYGNDQKIEFMRLKPEGKVDSTFGTNGLLKTQPIVPDVYINPSTVLHGIWNANETCILLSATKQPVTYSNYGIFKYKWPGLTPLSIQDQQIDVSNIVYPNPIIAGSSLHIVNIHTESNIQLINLEGKIIPLEKRSMNNSEVIVEIPSTCSAGNYFIIIRDNRNYKTNSIGITIQ